jgi:NitT/TauT family transport system permease protein
MEGDMTPPGSISGTVDHDDRLTLDDVIQEISSARKKRHRRHRMVVLLAQVGIGLVFLLCWQVFAGDPRKDRLAVIDSFYVSRPSAVLSTLRDWFADGSVYRHILATSEETVIGFLVGAVIGLVLGLALGSNRMMGKILSPFVSAAYSVPRLALVPLFVLWFGLGLSSKIVYITMVVFFLVFFNTFSGVREVSQDLTNILRVMGAGRRHLLLKVTIPSAMTWMLTGLRVSVPYALVAAVTAEIVSSNVGLGYLLVRSSNQFYVQGVFAAIVLMVGLSLVMLGLVVLLESWLLRWKRTSR